MKLKGSATVEAAIIIPLFTIMVVMLINLAITCHDRVIVNCASDKVCMEMEFSEMKIGKYNKEKITDLEARVSSYIAEKTLQGDKNLSMTEDALSIKTQYSEISKNNPMEYVRLIDAAEKLLGKGEDKNAGNQNNK